MGGRGGVGGEFGVVGEAGGRHGSSSRLWPRPCAAFRRSKSRKRSRPAPKGEACRAAAQRRTASTAFLLREEWRRSSRRQGKKAARSRCGARPLLAPSPI